MGGLTRLGIAALVSAQFQAAALVLVVPLAKTIAGGEHEFKGSLGPVALRVPAGTLTVYAAAAILGAAALDIWIAWSRARLTSRWEYRRREMVVSEFLHADHQTQSAERLGTLGMLTSYTNRGSAALGAIVNGFEALVTILIFLGGAFLLDYRAALLLIVTLAALSFVLRPVMARTKRYSQISSAMLIDYGREVAEATRMSRDVRVFHAATALGARLTETSQRLANIRRRANFVASLTSPLYQYLGMLMVVGSLAAAQGLTSLNVAVFGAIVLLFLRSLSFGQQLQASYQTLIDCVPYIERLEEMRAVYLEHVTVDGTTLLETVHRLDLDRVSYSYDGEIDALSAVAASFHVGEVVGIVGPSGSGKSTLSQLILRLREPTAGRILVNGTPAGEYTLASWYRHVSLVPQDPKLLHSTVADNIAFLDASITRERVIEAAKAAGIHEVIESLQDGYDTMIGPAFRDLSGGQIQRIGIARALARGAQVLVLDEPTSALDVHSERVIQAALESLRGKVLVLIIAHRLSTLSICDRILVLRDGKVESMGSLADVSERSDFFRRALDAGTLEIEAEVGPAVAPDDM